VLIPGSGGAATCYWQRVVPLLRDAGHEAVPVDLPGADPAAGLPEYARLAAAAIGGHHNAVLVSHSLGAFTAPMAAAQSRVAGIVLVNAMIPEPGETPGAWWDNTGHPQAQAAAARRGGYSTTFDLHTYFLHDVPADIAATGQNWPEEAAVFESACDFRAWPPVPVKVAAGADDRLFPLRLPAARLWWPPSNYPTDGADIGHASIRLGVAPGGLQGRPWSTRTRHSGHWPAQSGEDLVLASGVSAVGRGRDGVGRGRVSGRSAACPLLRGGCRRPG